MLTWRLELPDRLLEYMQDMTRSEYLLEPEDAGVEWNLHDLPVETRVWNL